MQTNLDPKILQSGPAAEVDSILRKCVHCGFCNATCPTYQLLGDELDGPRGRIYQMKLFFEGEAANAEMLKHLDRCLGCRSCETTCPSGVRYSRLLEIGREAIEEALPRPAWDRIRRWAIVRFINSARIFSFSITCARVLSPLLPAKLRRSIPPRQPGLARISARQERKVLLLPGCVQSFLTPNTNIALNNVLQRLGIETIEVANWQCCGATALHTSEPEYGLAQARQIIDSWWPYIESGAEAILVSASGCGVTVKDYARMLADDAEYADKATTISELYRDPVELVEQEIEKLDLPAANRIRVAFHTPCTLQHGLGLNHRVETMLEHLGYEICAVTDAQLCCGSAGTYSMLQVELSTRLRENKQACLTADRPDVIATANIGCQLHLAQGLDIPVRHWIELIDQALARISHQEPGTAIPPPGEKCGLS